MNKLITNDNYLEVHIMSAIYGMIQGNRGAATRGGSRASGFKATVQSWDGSIITRMSYGDKGELMVEVEYADGSASYGKRAFYGTFEEYIAKLMA
jgi:hypothetical protein